MYSFQCDPTIEQKAQDIGETRKAGPAAQVLGVERRHCAGEPG